MEGGSQHSVTKPLGLAEDGEGEAERAKDAYSGHSWRAVRPRDFGPWLLPVTRSHCPQCSRNDKTVGSWGCRGVFYLKLLYKSLAEELPMALVGSEFPVFGGIQA